MAVEKGIMSFATRTEAGVKGYNQDALAVPEDPTKMDKYGICLAVADGITLCKKGGDIAIAAVKIVDNYYMLADKEKPGEQALDAALQMLWNDFFAKVEKDNDQDYLLSGTTLTCALILEDKIHVRHLGDSHCDIFLPDGTCKRLTVEHSTPEGALLNYFGGELQTEAQHVSEDFPEGSKVILSSDGISYFIDNESMRLLASKHTWDSEKMLEDLFRISGKVGSTDDKTVVIGV